MSERHTILDSITSAFVPIHPDGHKFIAGFAVAALILFLIAPPLGWLGVIATLACAYFFRDPERVTPQRAGLVVSAADGKIVSIEHCDPAEGACARRGARSPASRCFSPSSTCMSCARPWLGAWCTAPTCRGSS